MGKYKINPFTGNLDRVDDSSKDLDDNGIIDFAETLKDDHGNEATAADVKDAVAKKHASGSDNQDLSGLVVKEVGKSLVADTEIAKIHTQNTDTKINILINTQTDNYVLVLTDDGKLVDMDKTTAVTLTVPKNSVVAIPIGTVIAIRQKGAGKVTITPVDGDVTIDSQDGLITTAQHAMASILKVDTNIWVAVGSLEA